MKKKNSKIPGSNPVSLEKDGSPYTMTITRHSNGDMNFRGSSWEATLEFFEMLLRGRVQIRLGLPPED